MLNKNLCLGFNEENYFFFIFERKGNYTLNELNEFVNLQKKRKREKLKQIKRNSINYNYTNGYEKVINIENYLNFIQKKNKNFSQNKENLNNQIIKLTRKSLIKNNKNNFNYTKEKINTIDTFFQFAKKFKLKNTIFNGKGKQINNIPNDINEKKKKIPISYIIDKIDELKKKKIELQLPLKYKVLLRSFIELDSIINHFKTIKSNKTINLNRISNSIESSFKHRFNLDIFRQILFIVPHFFIIKWIKNFENNDFDLLIDIPKDIEKRSKSFTHLTKKDLFANITKNFAPEYKILSNNILNQRKETFKKILLEIVNLQHEKYLKKNKIENYDPYIIGSWHKNFDIENIRDIPKFEIESKPKKINYYQHCIINNDIKKKLIEKALNDDKEIIENKYTILEKYCSKDFINNLRKKEEAIKISNEILKFSQNHHEKQELSKCIPNLIIQIQSLCLLHKKESWNISELISKLLTIKNINNFFNQNNILNYIKILIKIFPNWIKLIGHSYYGEIVLIDLNIEIRKEIIPKINLDNFLNI